MPRFLRAYENGKPVATPQHLTWCAAAAGRRRGDVRRRQPRLDPAAADPGSARLPARSSSLPINVATYSELRGRLIAAMEQSPAQGARGQARARRRREQPQGLHRPGEGAQRPGVHAASSPRPRPSFARKSAGNPAIGDPVGRHRAGDRGLSRSLPRLPLHRSRQGDLYGYAMTLVRAAEERTKPNAERLPGYSDSALPLLEKQVLDAEPIYPVARPARARMEPEQGARISRRRRSRHQAAARQGIARRRSPHRLVAGTRLADPAYRKALWTGGKAAIDASKDPMIVYARKLDATPAPAPGRVRRALSMAPVTAAQAKLADARFAAYGDTLYPDATFTLRISYGKVQGWTERGRHGADPRPCSAAPSTARPAPTRSTCRAPSSPARRRIDPNIVYDFVTTNDIIGGNSGSPVIDRSGAVIGAAFDGNIHSLARQLRLRRIASTGPWSCRPMRSRKRWRRSIRRRRCVAELKRP